MIHDQIRILIGFLCKLVEYNKEYNKKYNKEYNKKNKIVIKNCFIYEMLQKAPQFGYFIYFFTVRYV